MKLAVEKSQIIDGLQKAASIIPAKAGAAYLRSIWLKAGENSLAIMSTDANIEFTGKYKAEVEAAGLVGVQGRAFVDLVRLLPNGTLNLSIDENGNNLLLKQGKRNYKLPLSSSDWFQEFSPFPEENSVTWTGGILQDYIEKVAFCVDDEEDKNAISCFCLKPVSDGKIDVCGLNGHQFAIESFIYDDLFSLLPKNGLLIQKKYLSEIKKWLSLDEIEININEKRLYLRYMDGSEIISVPRATYEYPDYNIFMSKLDDENLSKLEISRKEAMDTLGRLQVFNTDTDRGVFMEITDNEVTFSVQGSDLGSARESLEAEYKGNISRIVFPTKDLMEILGHFASEKVIMNLTGVEGLCGIHGIDDMRYNVIIMPMKVAENNYYTEE